MVNFICFFFFGKSTRRNIITIIFCKEYDGLERKNLIDSYI